MQPVSRICHAFGVSADDRCLPGEHHRAEDQRRTNSAGKCDECHDNSNSEQWWNEASWVRGETATS